MDRRDFLTSAAAAGAALSSRSLLAAPILADDIPIATCEGTYATPADAMKAPKEEIAFVPCIYTGTEIKQPDYLATIDLKPKSPTYGKVVHRLPMPNLGDELHHFGWNACSSCHGDPERMRRYLVVPGFLSGRIHIIDVIDPAKPKMHKVIEPETIAKEANLSAPHTVHCLADGNIMLSMLGDAQGNAPGGFLLLDPAFKIAGRWEKDAAGMEFNYDFWYQPRFNTMISSQWAAPKTFRGGFKLEDVQAGKYGQKIHFWDWKERKLKQTIDLGDAGRIPLEIRCHHNPASGHGFVGAALSSSIWQFQHDSSRMKGGAGAWSANKVIQVDPVETKGWPFPVPGLITDLVLSLDDKWLYFSNWLHGDIRQYDVSDPAKPVLKSQLWLGGVIGKGRQFDGKALPGGPQMLQLSLDGQRLYVTSSLYSTWDDQFYPDMKKQGSYLLQIDCDTKSGGLTLNEKFHVDFGKEPHGPARAHEIRFPGGDSTSDIWV